MLFKRFILAASSFVIISSFYPGFKYEAINIILAAGALFAFFTLFIKPLLKIVALPFNLLTFGFVNFLLGALIVYLVSSFVGGFHLVSWSFAGANISGFVVPSFSLTILVSVILGAALVGLLSSILDWVFG